MSLRLPGGDADRLVGRSKPPFDVLALRVGDDTEDPLLYPLVGEGPSLVAAEPGDGTSSRAAVAKGLAVAEAYPRRDQHLGGVSNVHIRVAVTDSRVTFACDKYEKGGGWFGLGGQGVAVAAVANVASRAAAARRRRDKTLVGHVRHSWLSMIACRRPSGLVGGDILRLGMTEAVGGNVRGLVVTVTFPKGIDGPAVASEILARAVADRLRQPVDDATADTLGALAMAAPRLDTRGPDFASVQIPGALPATNQIDGRLGQ